MTNNSEDATAGKSGDEKTGTTIYLVAPAAANGGEPRQTKDNTKTDEGAVSEAVRKIVGGRIQVTVDPDVVTNQIKKYVTVLHDVAEGDAAKKGVIRLSEITLSLTISAEGNIGIASTSAEAGISLIFKRE